MPANEDDKDAKQQAAAERAKAESEARQERDAEIEKIVAQRLQAIEAETAAEQANDEAPFSSETQFGGLYKTSKGKFVDANGRPVQPGEPNEPLTRV